MDGYRDEKETLRRRVAELERQLENDAQGSTAREEALEEEIRSLRRDNDTLARSLDVAKAGRPRPKDPTRPPVHKRVRLWAFGGAVVCFALYAGIGDTDRLASTDLMLAGVVFASIAFVAHIWKWMDRWFKPAAPTPKATPRSRAKRARVDTSAKRRDPSVVTRKSRKRRGRRRRR